MYACLLNQHQSVNNIALDIHMIGYNMLKSSSAFTISHVIFYITWMQDYISMIGCKWPVGVDLKWSVVNKITNISVKKCTITKFHKSKPQRHNCMRYHTHVGVIYNASERCHCQQHAVVALCITFIQISESSSVTQNSLNFDRISTWSEFYMYLNHCLIIVWLQNLGSYFKWRTGSFESEVS